MTQRHSGLLAMQELYESKRVSVRVVKGCQLPFA